MSAIDGILLFDKPQGLSSNQALQRVRRLFGADKAGHTGSLDPLATGMLPICFGEATKIAGLLLGESKAYETACRLGVVTTTGDAEGEVTTIRPVPTLDTATIVGVLTRFLGRIQQVPPAYSAIKVAGQPLYKRARRGETIELAARAVEIKRIELLAHASESLRLHVECGSGTYIRSLVVDIGEALGCGAHVTALRRLWVAPFQATPMLSFEDLQALARNGEGALREVLLPLEQAVASLPKIELLAEEAQRLVFGQRFVPQSQPKPGSYCVFSAENRLLAMVEIDAEGVLHVSRGFNSAR